MSKQTDFSRQIDDFLMTMMDQFVGVEGKLEPCEVESIEVLQEATNDILKIVYARERMNEFIDLHIKR